MHSLQLSQRYISVFLCPFFFVSRKNFAWLFLLCWFVFFLFFFDSIFFEEIFRSRFTRLNSNKATILLLESGFLSLTANPWKNYWYWSKNHAVISFTGIVIRATDLKTIQSLNHIKIEKKMTNDIGKIWHNSTLSEMTHINSITSKIQLPLIHRYTK